MYLCEILKFVQNFKENSEPLIKNLIKFDPFLGSKKPSYFNFYQIMFVYSIYEQKKSIDLLLS